MFDAETRHNLKGIATLLPLAVSLLAWFALAYLGLAQLSHPVVAAVLFLFLINTQGSVLITATTALAVWGVHAGLNVPWLPSILVGAPVVPALYEAHSKWVVYRYFTRFPASESLNKV